MSCMPKAITFHPLIKIWTVPLKLVQMSRSYTINDGSHLYSNYIWVYYGLTKLWILSRNSSVMMCSLVPWSSGSTEFPSGSAPSPENPAWRTLTMFGDSVWISGAAASWHSFCATPLDSLLRLISLIRQGMDTWWWSSMKVLQVYGLFIETPWE